MPDVSYSRVNWKDSPSTDTPVNAFNLNKMDAGIDNCAISINAANAKISNMENLDITKFSGNGYQTVDSISYNPTTKKLGLKVNGADTVIPFSGRDIDYFAFGNTSLTISENYEEAYYFGTCASDRVPQTVPTPTGSAIVSVETLNQARIGVTGTANYAAAVFKLKLQPGTLSNLMYYGALICCK